MPEPENPVTDEWLTPAQIAEELGGLNPATVRQWITKGELKASRLGMRKLRVRRSDLEALLAEWQRSSDEARGAVPAAGSVEVSASAGPRWVAPTGTTETTRELFKIANRGLEAALRASARARPSDGYTDRLRAIADGFEHVAATCIHGSRSAGARWGGLSFGWDQLPYELRPGGNRPSGKDLWTAFDQAIEKLGSALAGPDLEVIGESYRQACDELMRVAKRIDDSGSAKRDSSAV